MVIKRSSIEAMRFAGAGLFEGGGAGIMSAAALAGELSDRQQAILDERLSQQKGAGGGTFVPVGLMQPPRIRDIEPVPGVYQVLQRTSAIPTTLTGGTMPQNTGFLHPKYGVQINATVASKRGRPVAVPRVPIQPTVSRSPIPNTGVGLQPTNIVSRGPTMALDLGAIITGLGGQYINARYPQQQNVGVFDSFPEFLGLGSVPDGISPVQTGVCPIIPKGYFINDKGEVRKKPKRRRRRLATPSDIKDLAALSSVTNGPEKKTWIATHPS